MIHVHVIYSITGKIIIQNCGTSFSLNIGIGKMIHLHASIKKCNSHLDIISSAGLILGVKTCHLHE